MKIRTEKQGFAMLEAVVIVMIFMILTSTLYLLAGMEYRYVQSKVSEDEAYYAAVSAVRLMAQEVVNGECEEGTAAYTLTYGNGMKKHRTTMVFETEEKRNMVEIPVIVWSERDEDELLLAAEVTMRGKTKMATLQLVKTQENSEEPVDNRENICTASDAEKGAESRWIPVSYGF